MQRLPKQRPRCQTQCRLRQVGPLTAQHPGAQVDRPTAMLNVRFLDHLIGWAAAALARRTNPLCGNGESRFPPRKAVRCCAARYFVAYRLWERFRDAPWQRIVRDGLVPATIGLIITGGAVMWEFR